MWPLSIKRPRPWLLSAGMPEQYELEAACLFFGCFDLKQVIFPAELALACIVD
jgi:hypothetical protein